MKVRKELTMLEFVGVSKDGGLVFTAYMENWGNMKRKQVPLKLISYTKEGVSQIAIDAAVSVSTVAELVAGLFSRYSNFKKCNFLMLDYRNISLKVDKNKGRKVIITMLTKQLRQVKQNDVATVDTSVLVSNCVGQFEFKGIHVLGVYSPYKVLQFEDLGNEEYMFISEVKNGVITPMFSIADVPKMIMERKRFFWPNSNFYGIKGSDIFSPCFC